MASRTRITPKAAEPIMDKGSPRAREAVRMFALAAEQHRLGRLDEALKGYARALALNPRFADVYNNMGVALRSQGRHRAAVACYGRSLALRPDNAGVYSNMGNALREMAEFERAREAHERAIELAPGSPEAIYNLGLVYRDTGRIDEAQTAFAKTLSLKEDHVDCHWDKALCHLIQGDLQKGFDEYEWRWRLPHSPPRKFDQPRWEGEDPAGKTLLIHQEQGFGDMIQFVRYVPLLKERGAEVIVECQPELARLFSTVPGVAKVVIRGRPLPDFDLWIPMLSVPRYFEPTLDAVPADVPYLAAPELHNLHLPRSPETRLCVGIVWAGKPSHKNDVNRSIDLDPFIDLMDLPGVAFYSLQKGDKLAQLPERTCAPLLADLGSRLQDFADTAAVIDQLDLVIAVDTSVVHLAGAMGKEAWVAVPYAADWRWMRDRDDSPWYPSVKLFRQSETGDWKGVFARIKTALVEKLEG